MFREIVKNVWGDDVEDYDNIFTPKYPEKLRDHLDRGESVGWSLTHKGVGISIALEKDPDAAEVQDAEKIEDEDDELLTNTVDCLYDKEDRIYGVTIKDRGKEVEVTNGWNPSMLGHMTEKSDYYLEKAIVVRASDPTFFVRWG